MRHNEKISVLLIGNDAKMMKFVKNSLAGLDVAHSILAIPDISMLFTLLDIAPMARPQLVLLDANHKYCLSHIRAIRAFAKYDSATIAVFDPMKTAQNTEELFAAGANICIRAQRDFRELEMILKKVITINWQYFRGSMNRETFFVAV